MFLGKADELQHATNAIDDFANALFDVELGDLPEALRRLGGHRHIAFGNDMHDGPAREHFFFVDNRVVLGARGNQCLAVGGLDRQGGVVPPRLDQQARVRLVASRQQEGTEHGDDDRGEHGQFEFAAVDEKQPQQVAKRADFDHRITPLHMGFTKGGNTWFE